MQTFAISNFWVLFFLAVLGVPTVLDFVRFLSTGRAPDVSKSEGPECLPQGHKKALSSGMPDTLSFPMARKGIALPTPVVFLREDERAGEARGGNLMMPRLRLAGFKTILSILFRRSEYYARRVLALP